MQVVPVKAWLGKESIRLPRSCCVANALRLPGSGWVESSFAEEMVPNCLALRTDDLRRPLPCNAARSD